MAFDYDAIVVGSGFGGAVTCCRLAEQGYRVLVLERGRRWRSEDYPREPDAPWIFDQYDPSARHGWLDIRWFPNMAVATGAGVGGGSLVYASVVLNAKPDTFEQGWPPEITYGELAPFYDRVGEMLNLQQVPANQWTERTRLMRDAAAAIREPDRFQLVDMAVSFDDAWSYDLEDPHDRRHSRTFVNAEGKEQGTCIHLGNCDIGCDVGAKNTLDLNYIARAEKHGAEVRPLHLVRRIAPEGDGYRVHYDQIDGAGLTPGSATGRIVVLAAGSLGSTELLLRCRDQHKSLPALSRFLGRNWSSNGDLLVPAIYPDRRISPSRGPTITAAIDCLGDRNVGGHHVFIEDGGFPDVLGNYLERRARDRAWGLRSRALLATIRLILRQRDPLPYLMPWFGQARDAADGILSLKHRWWQWGDLRLSLQWDVARSEATINALADMHSKLSTATGGHPIVPPTWTVARDLITPHPLGGCNMGRTPEDGVVDHRGEVFGYHNLYIADASVIPEALGLNPAKTVAALAERTAKLIIYEGR